MEDLEFDVSDTGDKNKNEDQEDDHDFINKILQRMNVINVLTNIDKESVNRSDQGSDNS